ncbi:MAG TPA: T9SS type A sorting domain-containing protein [Parafilimonas sp.]|nr:T9SS type A sorting domain-containing protein [Parafilimonas sp.]
MKKILRLALTQLLTCFMISSFSQTNITYTTPGTFTWTPPAGVTSVTMQMWGAGAFGLVGSNSGGGGAFVQTTAIPVTFGTTYDIVVGSGGSNPGGSTSFGPHGGSAIVTAQGGSPSGTFIAGGAASSGPYVAVSYHGGSGAFTADFFSSAGGGAGAGTCQNGADGSAGNGYGVGQCGGGSGGNPAGTVQGVAPGGGGAAVFGISDLSGGNGKIVLTYTCSPGSPGTIGTTHTITYPPELIPDSITNIVSPVFPAGVTIGWQQSTNNINFVASKTPNNTTGYRIDSDSLLTTTYYRRGNNACTSDGSLSNWSDTVKIVVFTSANGRNGQISGYVQTNLGSPIKDRKVFVQSLTPLRGRPVGFLDSAYTDQQGKFFVDSVFYGDKFNGDSATVRFKVYPDTANGHKYNPPSREISLTLSSHTYDFGINFPFQDITVFAVTGQVTQVCKQCLDKNGVVKNITGPLDSVRIVGIGVNNDITNNEKDSSTTRYLNPPGQYGRYSLTFKQADQYTITPSFRNHKFVPADSIIIVNSNVTNVNFNDTTTHTISGFYGAGCGDLIGTAVLEFDDVLLDSAGQPRASLFKKQVTTKQNGQYSIRLPARKYIVKIISLTVKDSLDPSTTQAVIKNYFKALPPASLTRDITNGDTTLDLIYHRAPQIAVLGLYDDSSRIQTCAAFKNYDFWPQGVRRPITFKVYQGPVSRGCLLDTGRVFITTDINNTVANYQHDTVNLVGGIGVDSLVAAQPNIVKDTTGTYSKRFTATYTDILNRSVSTDNANPKLPIIVVTGAAIDPSGTNFVTVSPQIPFLVLHDPPGSLSYAQWTKSVKSSQAMSFRAQKEETTGGYVNVKVGLSEILGMFVEIPLSFWVAIDNKFSTTNSTSNTTETVITNTSEQSLQTAADVAYTASDADLVYGAALNINYKVGTEIEWDSTHCAILDPRPVMVMDIKNDTTSFLYTQGYIKGQEIPRLQFAAAATKNPDSAAYFNNQIGVWQQLVDNNERNIREGSVLQNISFSNGTTQTFSNTLENSTRNTYDFDLSLDKDFAISTGFDIAGIGLDGGFNVGFKMTTGGSVTTETSTSTTTSYTLADNNAGGPTYEGDYLSVNVKKDPVYGTPMFETVAGGTQCPHEEGTIALDRPLLTAGVTTKTNVQKDTASFTVYMNNLSQDVTVGGARPYVLFVNAATSSGATVRLNGADGFNGVTFPIPNNGGQLPITVDVIRNTANGVYNYDNIQLIMSDPCFSPVVEQFYSNAHEYSTIELSADFQSGVSGVTLVTPANNWVANMFSNNAVPVTFNGYDTSKLVSIGFEYTVPGSGIWKTAFTVQKNNLGSTSTTKSWNISKIVDGPYNVRLKVTDKNNNIVYCKIAKGRIDRQPVQLFGTPQPASGAYVAGTTISYSYTDKIFTPFVNSAVNMWDMTANSNVPVDLSGFLNTIIIVPRTSITNNIGHLYRVIADSIYDLFGNVRTKPDTMYFTVSPSNFGTGPNTLNITANKTSIYEDDKGSINVRFTRNTKDTLPTAIYYNISGTANYGTDYNVLYNAGQTAATGINGAEGTIILPKDSLSVNMYIKPINDSILAPNKILRLTLSPGGNYSIGSNFSITDTILNHNTVKPIIQASGLTTFCSGDSVTLSTANKVNGVSVKSYLWSTGAKTQSIVVKTSGSYTVKVTDKNGLIGYSDPTVVTVTCGAPVNLAATPLTITNAALHWDVQPCAKKYVVRYRKLGNTKWLTDTVNTNLDTLKTLTANTTYEWQVATICQYPVIIISSYTVGTNFTTPVSLGAFAVTGTDDHSRANAGDGFSALIYPNPAFAIANVDVKNAKGPYSVVVTNLQGVVLWKAEKVNDSSVRIPLASLARGIYMVVVKDELHSGTLRLMKQ